MSPLLRLQSDERLAALAAEGSEGAFDELVRRRRSALVRACSRIMPGTRAEDAAQQALINAHCALKRNGPPDRFAPWLNRIGINAALKELRRGGEDALPLHEEQVDGVEQPVERLERRERLRDTLAAIGTLPEGQRRALVRREMEGRSHAEIARELGLTPGAARQLIHRARDGVRSAVTAITPTGLLLRASGLGAEGQTAEIVAGGIGGGLAGKAAATALVAGGIAGGVAIAPSIENRGADASPERPSSSGRAMAPSEEGDDADEVSGGETSEEGRERAQERSEELAERREERVEKARERAKERARELSERRDDRVEEARELREERHEEARDDSRSDSSGSGGDEPDEPDLD